MDTYYNHLPKEKKNIYKEGVSIYSVSHLFQTHKEEIQKPQGWEAKKEQEVRAAFYFWNWLNKYILDSSVT